MLRKLVKLTEPSCNEIKLSLISILFNANRAVVPDVPPSHPSHPPHVKKMISYPVLAESLVKQNGVESQFERDALNSLLFDEN